MRPTGWCRPSCPSASSPDPGGTAPGRGWALKPADNHAGVVWLMQDQAGKSQLRRVLGTWDLVAFAIMTMVPIAPMGIYGVIAMISHGHVPLAYAIAAVAMFFTAWGYAQFAQRYPEAG